MTIASAMADYRAKVGQRLRELREARDLSQEDAAHEIGVTAKTLSRWENGRRWPYGQHWTAIKDFYGTDPREGVPSPGPLGLGGERGGTGGTTDDLIVRLDAIEAKLDLLLAGRQEAEAQLQGFDVEAARDLLNFVQEVHARQGRDVGRRELRSRAARDRPGAAV